MWMRGVGGALRWGRSNNLGTPSRVHHTRHSSARRTLPPRAGRVAAELAEAADLARRCVDARPGLRAGWKLLGDALLALGRVAAGEPGADAAGGGAALPEAVRLAVEAAPEALRPAFRGRSSALRALGGARRAYAELVRLEGAQVPPDPGEAESESARPPPSTDVATATLAEALAVEELARAVAPGDAVALRSHASSLLQEAREQVRGALALSPACSRLWALCAATCREVRAGPHSLGSHVGCCDSTSGLRVYGQRHHAGVMVHALASRWRGTEPARLILPTPLSLLTLAPGH